MLAVVRVYQRAAPGRIEEPVSLLDLAPTVANLLGVREGWERYEGRNLLPLLAGERPARPVIVETWPFASFSERRVAELGMPLKVIFNFRDRSWEIYDLLRDPAELHNLHPGLPEPERRTLQQPLEDWLETHPLSRP